jgi:hypothetical protein
MLKVLKIYYMSNRLIKNQTRRRANMKKPSLRRQHAMFCGVHLRGASTNMDTPLGYGETHLSTNRKEL